jgi:3-oxoacyl-[acyl-carrier-protein] synthase-3
LQNNKFEISNYISSKLGSENFDVHDHCTKLYGIELADKIIEKTGPTNLFHCSKNEDSFTLAIDAYSKIKNKIDLSNINNLIFVSETNIYQFPGNSFIFASKTELKEDIFLYDINAGCSGFVDALILAEKLDNNTLIICSETYSKNIKNFDRSVSTLFSDCATVFFYDKSVFKISESFSFIKKNSFKDLNKKHNDSLYMNGAKIFSFVSSNVVKKIIDFCNKYHKKNNFKDLYLHQASALVINFFRSKSELNQFNIPSNINKIGNTVSSSIPMLMLENKVNINNISDNIFICGFGVGLVCTGAILSIKK